MEKEYNVILKKGVDYTAFGIYRLKNKR